MAAPWSLRLVASDAFAAKSRSSAELFPELEVAGSYREIGYQIGRRFRSNIRTVIERRGDWHRELLAILDSRGIVQTTNYISSTRAEVGLPRYVIGRAILEAETLAEARQIATLEPRAYPYHHNLGQIGVGSYLSVETVPGAVGVSSPDGFWVHTNHLLHPDTRDRANEDEVYTGSSSMSRYQVLTGLAAGKDPAELEPRDLLDMLSSHERAPFSPCRHPEGNVQGQTLGTAFVDLGRGGFRLYRGNPGIAVPGDRFIELRV